MTDDKDQENRKKLSLRGGQSGGQKGQGGQQQVRQSFSHGRSKTVAVEVVRRKRGGQQQGGGQPGGGQGGQEGATSGQQAPSGLTEAEREARQRALEQLKASGKHTQAEAESAADAAVAQAAAEAEAKADSDEAPADTRTPEQIAQEEAAAAESPASEPAEAPAGESPATGEPAARSGAAAPAAKPAAPAAKPAGDSPEEAERKRRSKAEPKKKEAPAGKPRGGRGGEKRRGKLTVTAALSGETEEERTKSLSAAQRKRERERKKERGEEETRQVREVQIPGEGIAVSELADRMAERSGNVVKSLMKMGVMATANQTIDAETAQLIVDEYGHRAETVSEADVESVLETAPDREEDKKPRAPVVTVMGHVDHGKTSVLDRLRQTRVTAKEAGGITQHIGAYQIQSSSGGWTTFVDTPGHAAFTQMRQRGANITDIVVLVVAADDSVKEQTVEAINHARAAGVPIVVAINKMDVAGADPSRVRNDLLHHEIVVEDMGGDTLDAEVSAATGEGLDQLLENIQLQAELQDLKANPDRAAEGVVVEAKLEKGRGPVATLLVQRGTLKRGDVFVVGSEWGRARALVNDKGQRVNEAGPSVPVEVLGLSGTPEAGEGFIALDDETRAREISEYRARQKREAQNAPKQASSVENLFAQLKQGEKKKLPVVVKGDVQGSVEAIAGAIGELGNDDIEVEILHQGVGGISESDVTLAAASNALVVGFNVRANGQARKEAEREHVDIRYYDVIYNVIDDVKRLMAGRLEPTTRERFLGNAEVRQVFQVAKVGRVAGCMITEGFVRRGARLRLIRDNVVIYEGPLKTLKRYTEDAKEVRQGYECGMSLEKFNDIKIGDVIECYELEEVAPAL